MAHIHEQIDFTVAAYIIYQGKVLMIHHKKLDRWLPIGGHVELDEDPEQALYREIEEECGLEVEVLGTKPNIESPGTKFLLMPTFFDIHEVSPTHKHVGMMYVARAKSDRARLAPEEHHAIKWFSKDDLADPVYQLSPAIRFYAEEALRRVSS